MSLQHKELLPRRTQGIGVGGPHGCCEHRRGAPLLLLLLLLLLLVLLGEATMHTKAAAADFLLLKDAGRRLPAGAAKETKQCTASCTYTRRQRGAPGLLPREHQLLPFPPVTSLLLLLLLLLQLLLTYSCAKPCSSSSSSSSSSNSNSSKSNSCSSVSCSRGPHTE